MQKIRYAMQDGRNFYIADSVEQLDADDCEHFRCIARVRDGNVEDAKFARHWFYTAICYPKNWLAIQWVHE